MDFFLTGVFASCAIGALKMKLPEKLKALNVWRIVGGMILIYMSFWTLATSAIGYNDSGYCTHIRTLRGSEGAKCNVGWYFSGWGNTTKYPHFITVVNTTDKNMQASSSEAPYSVRMADNWSGRISQTTRFELPNDPRVFLALAQNFGSPERLLTAALRPAVNASLDSVASHYSMEEYYTGGKRDKFKAEFRNALSKGMLILDGKSGGNTLSTDEAPTTPPSHKRIQHSFQKYGITVYQAVVHTLHPDSSYASLIKDRKHAANKRILAREKRLAEEEQHLHTVARQEIEVAKQKTEALIDQAKRTTNAETEMQISVISARGERDRAQIAVDTAHEALKRAKVDAEARKISAQAIAFERKALMVADGALERKIKAYMETNRAWADAFAKRKVPTTVFESGTGEAKVDPDRDAKIFMDLLSQNAARDLGIGLAVNPDNERSKDPVKTGSTN